MAHARKIILVALEEELPKSTLPGFHIEYTGVGKINASLKTAEVIQKFSPELIIN
jgi:nucleoside phosphorylase